MYIVNTSYWLQKLLRNFWTDFSISFIVVISRRQLIYYIIPPTVCQQLFLFFFRFFRSGCSRFVSDSQSAWLVYLVSTVLSTTFFDFFWIVSTTQKICLSSERRRRDLNPRAAINDLHPFQGCPFSHLGYFSTCAKSKYLFNSEGYWKTERMGFEPMRPFGQTVFKTASLWPLRYLSTSCLLQDFLFSLWSLSVDGKNYSSKPFPICQQLFSGFLYLFPVFFESPDYIGVSANNAWAKSISSGVVILRLR